MTYTANEQSYDNSAPIEAYIFTGAFGEFCYNDSANTEVINGKICTPLQIDRGAIDITISIDSPVTVDIIVPSLSQIAQIYGFTKFPRDLTVEVLRVHRGDDFATQWKRIWKGIGLDVSTRGIFTTIRTGSPIQAQLLAAMSMPMYQRQCNHNLYDERCKVVKASFTVSTLITEVKLNKITVDDDQNVNGALVGGQAKNTRTNEIQTILDNTDDVLKLAYPFIDAIPGDTLELSRGCRHNTQDCEFIFNNRANYGGFVTIPTTNPFEEN